MKTLPSILIALLLACCTAPQPAPVPVKPPAPVAAGRFVIKEYAPSGRVARTWRVASFTEKDFPRSVTFTADGTTITLRGSYQIDREP